MAFDLTRKRVFLSGPMTGLPAYNVTNFAMAHAKCKLAGALVVYDPAQAWLEEPQSTSEKRDHPQYMRECLRELTRPTTCHADGYDVLVQLDGWQASEGARCEAIAAAALGMDLIQITDVRVPAELMPILEGAQATDDPDKS